MGPGVVGQAVSHVRRVWHNHRASDLTTTHLSFLKSQGNGPLGLGEWPDSKSWPGSQPQGSLSKHPATSGWEGSRGVGLLSQPSKGGRRGCCEGPSRAYKASEAGVLLWPRDFVAPHRPGIEERNTLALLFFLFPLAISAVPKGLACLHLLIPCWPSHMCHLYAFQCSAIHTGFSTTVVLSEQQT